MSPDDTSDNVDESHHYPISKNPKFENFRESQLKNGESRTHLDKLQDH
jgi:hypothetical protein